MARFITYCLLAGSALMVMGISAIYAGWGVPNALIAIIPSVILLLLGLVVGLLKARKEIRQLLG